MFLRWSSSSLSTAHAMGIIMAAHAVLLSHIDRKHVTVMKPNKILHKHHRYATYNVHCCVV